MRIRETHRKHKVFIQFLFTYIAVLAIPILISIYTYTDSSRIVKEDILKTNLSGLEQASNMVDNYLKQVENATNQISLHPQVGKLSQKVTLTSGEDYYYMIDLFKSLSLYKTTNDDLIISFFIHYTNSDFLISQNNVYELESFYDKYFKYSGLDFQQWYKLIFKNLYFGNYLSTAPLMLEDVNYSAITYVQSIPLGSFQDYKGAVVLYLDEKYIERLVKNIDVGDYGWVYIADDDGNIISEIKGENVKEIPEITGLDSDYSNEGINIDNRKMIVTSVVSRYNKWKYIAAVPEEHIMHKLRHVKNVTISVVAVSLLLGIAAAVYFTYFNTKPLKQIVANLNTLFKNEISKNQNEFDFVKENILELVSDNISLREKTEKLAPIFKATFFERLINGRCNTEKEIGAVLEHIGLKDMTGAFAVVVSKIAINEGEDVNTKTLKKLDQIKAVINDIFINAIDKAEYIHFLDENKFVWLMKFPESNNEDDNILKINNLAMELSDMVQKAYNLEIVFGVGGIYNKPVDISKSYSEATQAIEYFYLGQQVIWFSEIPKISGVYIYPTAMEIKLINMVKQSDKNGVNNLLKEIYYENFIKTKLTYDMGWQLINELMGTALKVMDQENYKEDPEAVLSLLNDRKNLQETYEYLINIYDNICDRIEAKKKNHRETLIEKIKEYLNENFNNNEIGLGFVADKFGLTDTYLSQLFKETSGQNFSEYLEKKRVEKVCELLALKKYQISDIIDKVGYTNETTFRRAFKRVMGYNPSAFKKELDGS